jgi:hypothetical protein
MIAAFQRMIARIFFSIARSPGNLGCSLAGIELT